MKILFLHGWQSVPGGMKPTYLKDHGHEVINPKLPDDDFEAAVRIAQAEFDKHRPEAVVGSSRGGAVAINMNSGDAKLVLLCPAWKKYGTCKTVKPGTVILHSRGDDVVPFADSEELAKSSGAMLIEVGNDHRLADTESLEVMLEACLLDDEDDEDDEEVLNINERDWTGLCYTAVLAWARETEEEWLVVHGTVWSEELGKRIGHAWCEREDFVVEMTLPQAHRIIAKETYYRTTKAEVRRSYSGEEARDLALRHKHDGPWDKEK